MIAIELQCYAVVVVDGLTAAQARALTATKAVSATPGWSTGTWTITAGPYVGVLRCESVELRIRPRITIARLMYLLGYAANPEVWLDDPVDLGDHVDLWPAMAQHFIRLAEKALQRGLLQGYRTKQSAQIVMRGRLREAEQIRRHPGLLVPLELTFDEYDIDIAENQLLRAATVRLLTMPGLPITIVGRLRHLRGRLADVSGPVPGQPLPRTGSTRLNQRYQPALALARMILNARSVDVHDTNTRATGFLANMNTIFEEFVTVAISHALRPIGGRCVAQDKAHTLDVAGRIKIKPDLVHYGRSGRPDAAVDAKYKPEVPSGYPYADIYQMLSYCTALGLRSGHLIYAEGWSKTARHQIVNTGIMIFQHALDLTKPVPELHAEIDRIASKLVIP